ncbi:hypothetical protein R50073_41970 [Maricurvus nonylphenolicus]|uniref:substrate-binding periplasmic protein n=1 Tax=Maricurvus nonylphenolicus TaxID=1008307 RepID=UPI0036F35525
MPVPPRRIATALVEGHLDVAPIIRISGLEGVVYPEQKSLIVGEQQLFSLTLALVGLKKRALNLNSQAELKGYQIGAIRFHNVLLGKLTVQPQTYSTAESLLKSLYAGRIDLAFSAMPTIMAGAKHLGIKDQLHVALTLDKRSYANLAWSKSSGLQNPEVLAEKFDQALLKMVETGEVERIIKRYSSTDYFQVGK